MIITAIGATDSSRDFAEPFVKHSKNSRVESVAYILTHPKWQSVTKTIFSPKFGHVKSLDAICFVSPAGEPRLTPQQAYVFDKIITSFGKDMKDNIFGLFDQIFGYFSTMKLPYFEHKYVNM